MKDNQKAKLIKKILDTEGLPSLSPLAIQLVEMAADDGSSARDLAQIIEKDPSLATRLLKLVGSAFFARPEKVTSISQAVVLLGFKRVRFMALSLSLRDTFPLREKGGMDYNYFWKTSLYRALIAQDFARAARIRELIPEEAFIAGLILEIGMLMLYEASCSNEIKKSFPRENLTLEELLSWEDQNLGINHREAGSLILQRWRFSDHLVETQKYFGADAFEPGRHLLCKVVELARRATEIVFGQTADLYELQKLAQNLLNLEGDEVNTTLSETFNKVQELADQLRIVVDSQADIVMVMEKANKALARINASMDNSLKGLLDHMSQYDQSLTRASEEIAQSRREILQNTLDAVAHEIRNPLLAIGGFATRLARHAKEEDRGGQYAKIIAEESKRLESILKEIMDYSQIFEPSFSETDLVSIIDRVIDEFEGLFRERKVNVVRDFSQEALRVAVDSDGITMVLRELFKNATRMIAQDNGKVTVSVKHLQQSGQVFISISDNGRPIPDDIRDALLDSNLSTKTFCEGLGLPKARKIIDAHKGQIELNVQESRGNTIKLCLPTSQPT